MTQTSQRRRSRELVLQGLYQRQLSGNGAREVRDDLVASPGHLRADQPYFDELWRGVNDDYDALLEALAPHLSRKPADLSPIERSILAIGAWELRERLEIPYKVVINEAVELAKSYGGTDGHRFVNGVLDKLAADVRATEIAALHR
jgi:transcription antitermination protein NusB